jgi:hypothetical protein
MTRLPPCGKGLHRPTARLLTLGGALLLAACASTPPPSVALSEAKQAIAVADQAHITDASSPQLAEARTKLAAAELAYAQSNAAKNQAVNDEMLHSTQTLSDEMQRNSGNNP